MFPYKFTYVKTHKDECSYTLHEIVNFRGRLKTNNKLLNFSFKNGTKNKFNNTTKKIKIQNIGTKR